MTQGWSASDIVRVREMWAGGATCSMIAKELGRGRRAVISKVHRLGLSWRDSPRKDKRRTANYVRRRSKKNLEKDTSRISQAFKDSWPDRLHCHFIEGDRKEEWRWCGAPVKQDSSYCASHDASCLERVKS